MTIFSGQLITLEQTQSLARGLADLLVTSKSTIFPDRGIFIGFSGPLGVGKTELIRSLLRAVGVTGDINSPTFVVECVYQLEGVADSPQTAEAQIVHWDLYRWSSPRVPVDFFDYRRSNSTLVLVEWPERSSDLVDLLDLHFVLDFAGSLSEKSDAPEMIDRLARTFELRVQEVGVLSGALQELFQECGLVVSVR